MNSPIIEKVLSEKFIVVTKKGAVAAYNNKNKGFRWAYCLQRRKMIIKDKVVFNNFQKLIKSDIGKHPFENQWMTYSGFAKWQFDRKIYNTFEELMEDNVDMFL